MQEAGLPAWVTVSGEQLQSKLPLQAAEETIVQRLQIVHAGGPWVGPEPHNLPSQAPAQLQSTLQEEPKLHLGCRMASVEKKYF